MADQETVVADLEVEKDKSSPSLDYSEFITENHRAISFAEQIIREAETVEKHGNKASAPAELYLDLASCFLESLEQWRRSQNAFRNSLNAK